MGQIVKLETKYYKLELLTKWEHVGEVNDMLMKGTTPRAVSKWCSEHGFEISHPKLYEYKEILQKAISKAVTVEYLLGIKNVKRSPVVLQSLGLTDAKDFVKNELEVLDAIIQRGFNALTKDPTIRIQDAMKAIELKNKLTGGTHGGLTGYGLEQIKELEQAKMAAIVEIVKQYVPADKHLDLQQAILVAERKFYEDKAPHLLEQYDNETQMDMNGASTNKDNEDRMSKGG